ncbi:ABC transporter permease [Gordonia phosphorivorans]|uniref:ABC transporter permease n=1 Tax=Gordonia phosphorivorans TaxID=1056982 RepID=A0ABV6H5L3_9ACTN
MNFSSVAVITGLEVRQRIRSTRWKWTALALFALLTAIVFGSLYLTTLGSGAYAGWARELLTIALGTVLFVGMVGAPAISAAAINGDRRDGTLALVQVTPISAAELALGKWLGAWLASLTFLVIASPYLIWGVAQAASSVLSSIVAIVVVAVLLGCYCAIGLGFSALSNRPTASTMLTLSTVLFLLLGLPAVYGLSLPSTEATHTVLRPDHRWDPVRAEADPEYRGEPCVTVPKDQTFHHTENIWWLLAPNPVLLVADTLAAGTDRTTLWASSVPSSSATTVSSARSGPLIVDVHCEENGQWEAENRHAERYLGRSWYLGLAFTVLLGLIGFAVAVRRLRVPAGKLAKGVRVA